MIKKKKSIFLPTINRGYRGVSTGIRTPKYYKYLVSRESFLHVCYNCATQLPITVHSFHRNLCYKDLFRNQTIGTLLYVSMLLPLGNDKCYGIFSEVL